MNQKQLYLTFICLTAFLVKLNAATITWTGTTNNLWEEPTNWDVGIVPTSTDDVVINIGVQGIYSSSNINEDV